MLSAPLDLSWPSMVGALNVSKVFSKLQQWLESNGRLYLFMLNSTNVFWKWQC